MAAPKQSLYEILGIPRDANDLDIGLAFQRRMLELQRASPQDPSQIAFVTQAHEVLSNPARRAAYDASLLTAQEKAAAAAQTEAPDLVLEPEEAEGGLKSRRLIPIGIGIAIVVAIIIGIRMGHKAEPPKPAPEVAEAPKPPPPPPPPQPMSSTQILTNASQAVGRVLSYEMSGRAEPIGLAVAVEPGAFVTTCHGIPAGSQLVVRTGEESRSAALTVDDEQLDLCKLSVSGFNAAPLAIAADDARAGDRIYVLGANAKGELALTEGKVKQIRAVPGGKVIELSLPVAKAGSGGAVFDTFGRVVGIATTPHPYGAGLEVALPASWIAQMRSRGK
jgi:S1-C subfamily serine protease